MVALEASFQVATGGGDTPYLDPPSPGTDPATHAPLPPANFSHLSGNKWLVIGKTVVAAFAVVAEAL